MRLLLDTNIFIHIDAINGRGGDSAASTIDQECIELARLANDHGLKLCMSEATHLDLEKASEKTTLKAKMKRYQIVGQGIVLDEAFWTLLGSKPSVGTNDYVDALLINLVYRNSVHFLITKDKKLRAKAERLGLEEKVIPPNMAVETLKKMFEPDFKLFFEVRDVELASITLEQPIFESLKKDYPEFEEWYKRKAQDGRKAWILGQPSSLKGICIYDPTNDPSKNQMKLCTFKVAEEEQGLRRGELLLKQALNYAFETGKEGIFVEVHPEKESLISWFESFGFSRDSGLSSKGGIDQVILRKGFNTESQNPYEYLKNNYPKFLAPPSVNAYLVPILPQYVELLFSDAIEQKQIDMGMDQPSDRCIKKAYICNSPIRKLKKGDVLFFYASNEDKVVKTQSIVTMGIVDGCIDTEDTEELMAFVGNRTVYKKDELKFFAYPKKPALGIKFWHVNRIREPLPLKDFGIRAPMSIASLTVDDYNKIAIQAKLI